uniref:Uncharacterized protein n=1 Tax=Grammatophora oceanica TaxID=210454 RepID=A0A7S1YHC6_9STRA|mmetsp:Transcript_49241/g.73420  ORF Transcript_49241/g.73420 Transcript_49241/m.73420 type:complete len:354 (+) Transcript_49241:122-1183(+)|eukprot:CAMPEP_0194047644 /NCGR_PEP_ID=MMETSP0009_2-20130614/25092_1 /TAXON_ID=210454 /ORGANISM="Grammatophora oceanica, Strain CCMP 410" /LENGTH=353 /DNA_ID=CAMNT_0038693313 /DNA_START=122 /DNA_END=1183 /DNA_ORIENTATION=-
MRKVCFASATIGLASCSLYCEAFGSFVKTTKSRVRPLHALTSPDETGLFHESVGSFDPLGYSSMDAESAWDRSKTGLATTISSQDRQQGWAAAALPALLFPVAAAAADGETVASPLKAALSPQNFNPVCPASDNFYRFLQGSTETVVGKEAFTEYGPLIAGGLLRIRLELCVVESFFNEAVGPFIKENGLSWILPLHETVETFLAGTIFSLASTFILVGSTKIVTVVITYADVFLGVPARVLGGFAFDRAVGKPVTLDIGFGPFKTRVVGPPDEEKKEGESGDGPFVDLENADPKSYPVIFLSGSVKSIGEVLRVSRELMEAFDLFVGRYLVLIATAYIGLKLLHYKVFPDFP